jgi:DNA invertase Pin-like site-specific DNA recombinase
MSRDLALVYLRLSMIGEDDASLDMYEKACIDEAKRRNLRYKVFREPPGHRSGRFSKYRPAWKEFIASLDNPETAAVIVPDLSRPTRNLKELLEFDAELRKRQIEFISLREQLDTSTAAGRLLLSVLGSVNEWYANDISERLTRYIGRLRDNGGTWGRPVCGLKFVGEGKHRHPEISEIGYWIFPNGSYVVGKQDAKPTRGDAEWHSHLKTVKRFFELYTTTHFGLETIAAILRKENLLWTTRDGLPIPTEYYHLRHITHRSIERYRGFIDDDTINLALDVHAERLLHANRRPRKFPVLLLWQIVFCDVCGGRFYVNSYRNARHEVEYGYRHERNKKRNCPESHTVVASRIERQTIERLKAVDAIPLAVKKQIIETFIAQKSEPQTTDLQYARLVQALDRLPTMLAMGDITRAQFLSMKARLQSELDALPRPRSRVTTANETTLLGILSDLGEFIANTQAKDPTKANLLIRSVLAGVYIRNRQVVRLEPREWCAGLFRSDGHAT